MSTGSRPAPGHSGGPPLVDIQVAEAMVPLLAPARYKAAYGGRAGTKSHFFAEQIVLQGQARGLRVACIREVQNSIKESVRQLIIDKIRLRGENMGWEILESEIRNTRTGTIIIFKGMQSYNADNIKSLEGYDIVWVEEAQTLSSRSLRILRPTIRKVGSQLWFSWNPRHDTDAVDVFFRGQEPPPDAIIVNVNHRDNPWLSDEIKREIEHDYKTDPDMAYHVWEGGYEIVTEGAYYARAIAQAEREGRIGHYPYDPRLRLRTAWDIGVDDYTAVWFIQDDGFLPTVVDYYETSGDGARQVVEAALPELIQDIPLRQARLAELGREERFRYEKHCFPHDVMVREWGGGARERWRVLKELGVWPIGVGTQVGPEERINATRRLLPLFRFHNTKRVQVGLSRLRRYARKFNEQLQVWEGPLKDINTHGADAFGEYCIQASVRPAVAQSAEPDTRELTYEAVTDEHGITRVIANKTIKQIVEERMRKTRERRR